MYPWAHSVKHLLACSKSIMGTYCMLLKTGVWPHVWQFSHLTRVKHIVQTLRLIHQAVTRHESCYREILNFEGPCFPRNSAQQYKVKMYDFYQMAENCEIYSWFTKKASECKEVINRGTIKGYVFGSNILNIIFQQQSEQFSRIHSTASK